MSEGVDFEVMIATKEDVHKWKFKAKNPTQPLAIALSNLLSNDVDFDLITDIIVRRIDVSEGRNKSKSLSGIILAGGTASKLDREWRSNHMDLGTVEASDHPGWMVENGRVACGYNRKGRFRAWVKKSGDWAQINVRSGQLVMPNMPDLHDVESVGIAVQQFTGEALFSGETQHVH